ncbi:MAG TPA: Crp/Fnr family transcriptional regulator [Cyclobacteriaceae bacterium]|nr:Crp/Fnr family transcriptional regulator [Cyclobacteriaceae bacterium]
MPTPREIESQLTAFFEKELISKIMEVSAVVNFNAGDEIIREGQYMKTVPLLLRGLVKVFTRNEDKELLLYYIQPLQSCVMTFNSSLKAEKSKALAVAEEDSTILLIPSDKISKWIQEYPKLNQLFYDEFEHRYLDLLETVQELVFDRLDKRLYKFLKEKAQISGKNPLNISHQKIASELGSSREVITRVLKKLEKEKKIEQHNRAIRVL